MCKVMKQISAFLLMLVMAVIMIPGAAFAAEDEESRAAIYVQVPEDWENPCIWAWDEDGNNAFDVWPGGEMDADTANEGWYYIWIPSWANHVIVNANEGSVQTDELVLEGKDAWLTVSAADAVEVSYDRLTTGDTPEYVEKFEIHAKVDAGWENPCLWAWSAPDGTNAFDEWPGQEMKEDENGWYTSKAPVWVNSIIINGNAGEVQTEDISIDPAEIWVTVDAEGNADFSYTDPDKEEVANITVYAIVPEDWENACLWAWSAPDGTNVFATWPGEAMEEENGWLKKEIPGWVNSIIVNGNDGSIQTTDITVDAGKDVWVVVNGAEDYEVSYEEPDVSTVQSDVSAEESAEISTEVNTDTTNSAEAENSSNSAVVVIIVIVAVVVIAGIVVVVRKKSKEN